MSQLLEFKCCFEKPEKDCFMKVITAPEYNNIQFVNHFKNEVVSVCIRENDVDDLLKVLHNFKEQRKLINKFNNK